MPKKYSIELTSRQMLDIAFMLTIAAEADAAQFAKCLREGFNPFHATKETLVECFAASMEHYREYITLFLREAVKHRSGSDRKNLTDLLKSRNDMIDYLISEYTSLADAYMGGK